MLGRKRRDRATRVIRNPAFEREGRGFAGGFCGKEIRELERTRVLKARRRTWKGATSGNGNGESFLR